MIGLKRSIFPELSDHGFGLFPSAGSHLIRNHGVLFLHLEYRNENVRGTNRSKQEKELPPVNNTLDRDNYPVLSMLLLSLGSVLGEGAYCCYRGSQSPFQVLNVLNLAAREIYPCYPSERPFCARVN